MQDRNPKEGVPAGRTYVALLRGINVGGRNKLPMKDLSAMFVGMGCEDVRTYIQSGNIVFRASQDLADGLPSLVSAEIATCHNLQIPVVLRTASEFDRIVRDNPFLAAGADPAKLHVGFLADTPDPTCVGRLDPDRSPPDAFEVQGREVYLHFPTGVARSRLDNAYCDRTLNTVCTIRNWRTVRRLQEMASGD